MIYEAFIARRYLLSKQRGALVTIITMISVLGVAIGVCALVVVISVMDGADEDLFRRMIDIYAHVRITTEKGGGFENYEEICKRVESIPGVKGAAPAIGRQAIALIKRGEEIVPEGMMVIGIDPQRELNVTGINKHTIPPNLPMPGEGEIVLGTELARWLGKNIGDKFQMVTEIAFAAGSPGAKRTVVRVAGLLRSGYYEFDKNAAYVSLAQARRMFVIGEDGQELATEIRIAVDDPFNLKPVMKKIQQAVIPMVPKETYISSWEDWNRDFFNALKLEKFALFVILLLVIIVAAFNIIGTQILVVLQKTREVGILMSMGVPRRSIRHIFWGFGLMIGIVGTIIGVLAGIGICWVIANTQIIQLPAAVYGIDKLPVKVNALTVTIIVACSMLICMGASVFPAWRASKLDPVEALRYE